MKRRNFFLPDELMADAQAYAEKIGINTSDFVRLALTKYIEALKRAEQRAQEETAA